MNKERELCVFWSLCPGLEPSTFRKLYAKLGSASQIQNSRVEDWCRAVPNVRRETIGRMKQWQSTFQQFKLSRVEDGWRKQGIDCTTREDVKYPPALRDLYDPPVVLFTIGNLEIAQKRQNCVSIVGTRRASSYGLEATRWISSTLVQAGITVCSGLAMGIDACAGEAGLDAGGAGIAVLGCGVDVCYPMTNQRLYNRYRTEGLLVSEYRPGCVSAKHHFPERNRMIAALSDITVVVQAGEKSGSLLTAMNALELGRDVYVVPGPITSKSFRGSNQLLEDGAIPLVDPNAFVANCFPEVLQYGTENKMASSQMKTPGHLTHYVDMLHDEGPLRAGELAQTLGKPPGHVYAALLELELGGLVKRMPDGRYYVADAKGTC